MEGTLASNALEIAIIGGMSAVIVAFITIGSIFVFRLFNRVDQLADQLAQTTATLTEKIEQTNRELSDKIEQSHRELGERIEQTHRELSDRIEQTHRELGERIEQSSRELREEFTRQMAQTKAEIIGALVNHSHPEPSGPPVFTAPPPVQPEPVAQNGTPDPVGTEPEPAVADD